MESSRGRPGVREIGHVSTLFTPFLNSVPSFETASFGLLMPLLLGAGAFAPLCVASDERAGVLPGSYLGLLACHACYCPPLEGKFVSLLMLLGGWASRGL